MPSSPVNTSKSGSRASSAAGNSQEEMNIDSSHEDTQHGGPDTTTTTLPMEASSTSPSGATATTSINPTSISNFLQRDIGPDGHRVLLPFFSTRDLLHLSICSKAMIKYRHCLSRIRLSAPPLSRRRRDQQQQRGLKQGVINLLKAQERVVTHLSIASRSAIFILDEIDWHGMERLECLDISTININDRGLACITTAMRQGRFSRLEELVLKDGGHRHPPGPSDISEETLAELFDALSEGACPRLRQLVIGYQFDHDNMGAGEGLAAYLATEHCSHLEELDLFGTWLGEQGAISVAEALRIGNCANLTKLELSRCFLSPEDGQALGFALQAHVCPKLKYLGLNHSHSLEDLGASTIFRAIEIGGLPALESIHLMHNLMSAVAGGALARALGSKHSPNIRCLNLMAGLDDPDGTLQVLQALKYGSCPLLEEVDLSATGLTPEHSVVLCEALASGALSRLCKVTISFNDALGDEGALPLFALLADEETCPALRELELTKTGMTWESLSSISQSISAGTLKRMESIFIYEDGAGYDSVVIDFLKALGTGCLPSFQWCQPVFSTIDDVVGQAVIEAFRDGQWPNLKKVIIAQKREDNFSFWGIRGGRLEPGQEEAKKEGGVSVITLGINDMRVAIGWLRRALVQGALPSFRELAITTEPSDEDINAINGLYKALKASRGIQAARDFVVSVSSGR